MIDTSVNFNNYQELPVSVDKNPTRNIIDNNTPESINNNSINLSTFISHPPSLKSFYNTMSDSDSDDDILGITDNPIQIKTIHRYPTIIRDTKRACPPGAGFASTNYETNKSDISVECTEYFDDSYKNSKGSSNDKTHTQKIQDFVKPEEFPKITRSLNNNNYYYYNNQSDRLSWRSSPDIPDNSNKSHTRTLIKSDNDTHSDIPVNRSQKRKNLSVITRKNSNINSVPRYDRGIELKNFWNAILNIDNNNKDNVDTDGKKDIKSQKQLSGYHKNFPTMEIINSSYSNRIKIENKVEKLNKYQRMREIRGVLGFVVNVHDATNFDIDIDISPELHEKYRDVISNQYTYQDFGSDFLENPDISSHKITPEIGTTYRCRLKGVGINQLSTSDYIWKSNQICLDIKQIIDRADGWVICNLSDIDVYHRLLVDIFIPISPCYINLRDYLLNKMINENNPIFYPYTAKNYRSPI